MTAIRHPTAWPASVRRWGRALGGDQALYPIIVLFGLNAVDELDRTAFGVLLPNIRDHFGLNTSGILTVVAVASLASLLMAMPIGFYADRLPRVWFCVIGATAWGVFSVMTGLATSLVVLGIARAGSGIGKAVNDPVHNSLIADYYDIAARPGVFSVHRAANAVGSFAGPLLAGVLAFWLGWRAPFIIFAVPTAVFVVLALRLREPNRGYWERRAMSDNVDTQNTEDVPPSFAESWRICWSVRTLRRLFYSLPFLAMSIIGLVSLSALLYEQVFHLDERARGFVAAAAEPAALIGLFLGVPVATRLLARDPGLIVRFLGGLGVLVAIAFSLFALAPNLGLAIAMNVLISGVGALLAPGIYASLSLAVPPKIRAFGFAVSAIFVLPGLVILPFIGWIADNYGIRQGLLVLTPVLLVGAAIIGSAAPFMKTDINKVWTAAAAQSEVLYARRQGQVKLLLVRGVDVHYSGVQVLFSVDFEIDEGEIVALLGTNGAGKSTLLRSIVGLAEASGGAIIFDGRDMTHTPPEEVAGRGATMVPGGQGVFSSLTVRENLQLAGWLQRGDRQRSEDAMARVLGIFPVLAERLDETAGNLSGGQQQMLTLSMAFIERPRLLMIDELSLGLAPVVVGQLLALVQAMRDEGTTIILVEQSVNVALSVAQTAYFMEKGEIRFHGPTAELLERPDVLRSVFLQGAATGKAVLKGLADVGATTGREAAGPVTAPPTAGPRSEVVSLSVEGVSKSFGGISALEGVSFSVAKGEILGFIGPNGAGKTTLFDVISGFLPSDGGRQLLRSGADVYDVTTMSPEQRASIGLGRSFQDGRLFPALTVAETIAVALETDAVARNPVSAALRLPHVVDSEARVWARVDELIELMGLGAFRNKFVHELSTGSRRIVDLACVLAHRPSVLLLDEPSSGIAQRETEALAPLLVRVRDELDASLLVIEHDLPLLMTVADRVMALDLGVVIASGAPDDVVHHPAVIASYVGTSAAAIGRSGSRQPTPT